MPDFWIAFAQANGTRDTATERRLSPAPTRVVYPTDPLGKRHEIPNGSVVLQQPLRDPRIRQWVWEGYPEWYWPYRALWSVIEPLRSRYRYQSGNSAYIWVRDFESQGLRSIGSAGNVVTPTYSWFKCRVVEVSRKMGTTSSLPTFDTTVLGFVIEDAAYNDLG